MAGKAVFFFRTVELLITAARLIHFDKRQISQFKHLPLAASPVSSRSTYPRGLIGLSNDTSQHQINQLGKLFKIIPKLYQPTVEISWELPCKITSHPHGTIWKASNVVQELRESVKQVKPVESNMHVLVKFVEYTTESGIRVACNVMTRCRIRQIGSMSWKIKTRWKLAII